MNQSRLTTAHQTATVADPGEPVGACGVNDGAEMVEFMVADGKADHRVSG